MQTNLINQNASAATTAQPKFTASKFEMELMRKIVERARKMDPEYETMDALMDISATHCSGNPMDLVRLLGADDFNFAHDVFGIRNRLDRRTGKLTGLFSPRFSI